MKRKVEDGSDEEEGQPAEIESDSAPKSTSEASNVPARQVYMTGFRSATEDQIREFFATCGGVTSMYNKQGKTKAVYKRETVLCTFKKDKALKKAIALNGTSFLGHAVRVGPNTEPIQAPKQAEGSERVFVGNLPLSMTPEKVEKMFSKCGDVVYVRFVYNEEQKFRGFCYITFRGTTGIPVKNALELDGAEVGGREIRVDQAAGKRRNFVSGSDQKH